MTLTVGILSPGDMGSGIGLALRQGGLDVLTCVAGRSALTRLRAEEAGMRVVASLDELVTSVDVLLSVLVPAEATGIATTVAASLSRTGAHPVYVECNAIAPQTVRAIEQVLVPTGCTFVDAGIIGGPPRHAGDSARFYCSGPDTGMVETLGQHGLDVRVVGPEIGQASGLKMVYAASTKGTTALWTELLVAAQILGLKDALLDEFGPDHVVAKHVRRSIPGMPRRARRWVGEMEEIAATFGALGLTPSLFTGVADMYRLVSATPLADQTSREPDPSLAAILETLADAARG